MRPRRRACVSLLVGVGVVIGLVAPIPAHAVTFTVTNTNNGGAGSLRQAMINANATPAADDIAFNIPGAGVHVISPTSPLPVITSPVNIDGTTEPSFAGSPAVQVSGSNAGAGADGLRVAATANASVIRALAVTLFDRDGIVLMSDGNVVKGCHVGISASGTATQPNGRDGVSLLAGAANNTIGGPTAPERNLLSANGRAGVFMTGAGTTGNKIQGNLIGTFATGGGVAGNRFGVWISAGASANTVGGGASVRNVISANTSVGVLVGGTATQGNLIRGNTIGMDAAGTGELPNRFGVLIGAGTDGNVVGGTGGESNLISGNFLDGVAIQGAGTQGNVLRGNRIGLEGPGSTAAPNGVNGVTIRDEALNNTVRNNVVSGNLQTGILITGEGTSGNDVFGNKVGTNIDGTADVTGQVRGLSIRGGATGNDVFGKNIVSGHSSVGIQIAEPGTNGNLVRGNFVGVNAAGTAAIPNSNGVLVSSGAGDNRVGGTTAADRNVISGNSNAVDISVSAPGNLVQGNYIGLNAAGTAAVPNIVGVRIFNADNTTIGGTAAGAGNVISGNTSNGVLVAGSTTTGTVIQGNRIGTNPVGTVDLGNAASGVVLIQGVEDVLVGGTTTAARNLISGNTVNGVIVTGGATNVRVQGNFIGTDAAGSGSLGNGSHGVAVADAAHDNLIGGTGSGAGNRIAHNGGAGVLVGSHASQGLLASPAGLRNTLFGNRIYSNGGLGIDLGPFDGVTANDTGDLDSGPNGLLNFPIVTAAISGGDTFVSGEIVDGQPNRTFRVEFFADPDADPSGNGEGRTFLGAGTVTTDTGGDADFVFILPGQTSPGTTVSATASNDGNTSEFGPGAIVE